MSRLPLLIATALIALVCDTSSLAEGVSAQILDESAVRSAIPEGAQVPDVMPPIIAKSCVTAGYEEHSPGFVRCANELIEYIRFGHKPPAGPGVTLSRVPRGVNIGAICNSGHWKEAKAAGVEGAVTLFLYIGADGLVKEVLVRKSSGSTLLDVATVRCLLDPKVRFEPQMHDGVREGSWDSLKYTWHKQ